MLGAITTGISRAQARTAAFCSGWRPVVPITIGTRCLAQASAWVTVPAGVVKSITTSQSRPRAFSSWSRTGTSSGGRRAATPASIPTASSPGRSVAATSA